jgi:hypothetical protein
VDRLELTERVALPAGKLGGPFQLTNEQLGRRF